MDKINLPRKLFRVEDLTFVLPDDFEGGIEQAFELLITFIHDAMKNSIETDKPEEEKLATILNTESGRKVSMNYGIFELGNDQKYHLK